MTKTIQFLDSIDRAPAFGPAAMAYDQAVDALEAAPELCDALLRRDASCLAGLLSCRPRMVVAFCTPHSEEAPRRSPEREDEGDAEVPDRVDRSPAGE